MARGGIWCATLAAVVALALVSSAAAQNNVTATRVGNGDDTTSQAQKFNVTGNGGCQTFTYTVERRYFNYSAFLGVPTVLPGGCTLDDLKISKLFTVGTCPEQRNNNYKVPSLHDTVTCSNPVTSASTATCNTVLSEAPSDSFATKGIGQSDEVDHGNICWNAPTVYFFVQNSCATPITVDIKVSFDDYIGTCSDSGDTDDGGDDAGGPGADNNDSGLSAGAKAGIAIGVIVGVALIAAVIAAICCCQLRPGTSGVKRDQQFISENSGAKNMQLPPEYANNGGGSPYSSPV